MAQNVGRLGVVLALDTAEFIAGLEKAQSKVANFANKAIPTMAGAGIAAFSAMTYKALAFADSISDVSAANEIAIASILKLSEGLELSGGHAKNAGKLLASFTSQIDSAAQGSADAQKMFAKVGVSLGDIGKLSNEQLFEKTLTSLAKINDVVTRNAMAVQIFGKAVKGVDIKALADEISQGKEEFQKYSEAIRIAGDLHDKLEAKATKTSIMFTNTFLPTMNAVFDSMNKSGSAFESAMEVGGKWFQGFIYTARTLVTILQTINAAVNLTALTMEALTTGNAQKIPDLVKEYDEYVASLRAGDKEFAKNMHLNSALLQEQFLEEQKKIMSLRNEGKISDEDFQARLVVLGKNYENLMLKYGKLQKYNGDAVGRPTKNAPTDELTKAMQLSGEYARQAQAEYDKLKRQGEMIYMTENERKIVEAVGKLEEERNKKKADIQMKLDEAIAKNADKKVIEALQQQLVAVDQLSAAYIDMTRNEMYAQQEAQQSFEFGWNKAFKQYAEDANNYAKLGGEVFSAFTNSMTQALEQFMKTGKLGFKSFANSIISELIRIQAQAMAMSMFRGLSSLFSVGSSISLGSMPLGEGTTAGFGLTGASAGTGGAAGLQFRASGGDVFSGSPYVVGENGPELFVPNQAGTIVPNGQMSDAMNQPTVVYNGPYIANMNAMDTQTATQFLAKNKMAIWSANQSASRSIPVSR